MPAQGTKVPESLQAVRKAWLLVYETDGKYYCSGIQCGTVFDEMLG